MSKIPKLIRPVDWIVPTDFPFLHLIHHNNNLMLNINCKVRDWFYELLIAEFVYSFSKIRALSIILKYFLLSQPRQRHEVLIWLFHDHPLILMAINYLRDPRIMDELPVPEKYTVERKAIGNKSYPDVLRTMHSYQQNGFFLAMQLSDPQLLQFYFTSVYCKETSRQWVLYETMEIYAKLVVQKLDNDGAPLGYWSDLLSAKVIAYTPGATEDPIAYLCQSVYLYFGVQDYGPLMMFKHLMCQSERLAILVLLYHAHRLPNYE